MASLVTALANDMHVKMTPPNIPLIRSKMLFQNTHDPEKTLLKNILQRINDHINKNTHKNLSVVDYSFAISQPEYIKETVRRANLSLPDTLTKNWTKSVGQNFRRVSSSQFSTQKFPNKHDPRKNLVWEYGALEGPFLLKPAGQRSLTLDKMPPILQTVILGEMFPLYRKILSHPNFIGHYQLSRISLQQLSTIGNVPKLTEADEYSILPQEIVTGKVEILLLIECAWRYFSNGFAQFGKLNFDLLGTAERIGDGPEYKVFVEPTTKPMTAINQQSQLDCLQNGLPELSSDLKIAVFLVIVHPTPCFDVGTCISGIAHRTAITQPTPTPIVNQKDRTVECLDYY
uniref:Uncharacterized protein n=1 Tax=Ditylenchus dipsaci TaxID=166011 RepID=A0A915DG69_9BILA